MMKNWLVTGGCGFIGTSLIKRLTKEGGHRIRVVDDLSVGSRKSLGRVCSFSEVAVPGPEPTAPVELVVGDIRDAGLAEQACQGMDAIVHLAANTDIQISLADPLKDCETNVIGTANYLEGARKNKVGHFVFASSAAAPGECEPPVNEQVLPRPVSPYGASKLAGEGYCFSYYQTFGVKTVILRFGNVYGPLSEAKNSVVAKFFKRALSGEPLEIYGDGEQTRDFICTHDLVDAIILAANLDRGGELFQIASSRGTSVNEIAAKIKELVENKTGRKVSVKHTAPLAGEIRRSVSDISKARRVLGYQPKFDLDQGLSLTLDFFLSSAS